MVVKTIVDKTDSGNAGKSAAKAAGMDRQQMESLRAAIIDECMMQVAELIADLRER